MNQIFSLTIVIIISDRGLNGLQVFSARTSEVIVSHQIATTSKFPQEGWVEQDPLEILNAVKTCIEKCIQGLQEKEIESSDIVAVGITNQRETTIAWDSQTGKPLHNAISNYLFKIKRPLS